MGDQTRALVPGLCTHGRARHYLWLLSRYLWRLLDPGHCTRQLPCESCNVRLTIFLACIISSPGNEWRGYTLQPPDRKLPFKEYFKPVNYARSTGIGATIMGISLMVGMLITPLAEALFAYLNQHRMYAVAGLVVIGG